MNDIEILQDYYVVRIERRYEDQKTKSGIIMLNSAYIDDESMDRYEYKRLYGTVLAVPKMFSDTPHMPIDEGYPPYRKFIGHDDIVDKMNRGYRSHDNKTYYCSTFDKYPVVTYADIAKRVDVNIGDTVYFHEQVTESVNFLYKDGEAEVYKMCVTDIFAVRRDGKLITQGEWVIIKPNMETWEEITTPSGIIKKPQPDRKVLEGIMKASHYEHCPEGMKIIYVRDADCEVRIDGEVLFVMPVKDVLGQLTI